MDSAYFNALAQLDDIDRQLQALRQRRERALKFLELHAEFALDAAHRPAVADPPPATPAPRPSWKIVVTAKDRIALASAHILSDGTPRHTRELLPLLEQMGVAAGATDKLLAVSKVLGSYPDFIVNRRRGWTLRHLAASADDGAPD